MARTKHGAKAYAWNQFPSPVSSPQSIIEKICPSSRLKRELTTSKTYRKESNIKRLWTMANSQPEDSRFFFLKSSPEGAPDQRGS
ncbi:hypothetical protein HPP92_026681 [Vanilla planifolia]|uniref:Uncharacterized protein n=1 Tax=Vanilla planifolia TaxID=51239 RepID=A0A835PCK4_VANPL|nr:hypothetical protein HPP92_026681 [Vanilla planifolia]